MLNEILHAACRDSRDAGNSHLRLAYTGGSATTDISPPSGTPDDGDDLFDLFLDEVDYFARASDDLRAVLINFYRDAAHGTAHLAD